jgi:hypothetical protein
MLLGLFPDLADMRIVDLGGTVDYWLRAPIRPALVVVVNLFEPGPEGTPGIIPVRGDACRARQELIGAGIDPDFDLVVSNSLIEHLGGHAKRVDLATEIAALAPRHWVQTPYRYFPVEPHWLFPMMQFLPLNLRVLIARWWPLSHSRPRCDAEAASNAMWTELLSVAHLRWYFADSRIIRESLLGFTKSIIAVRM